MICADAQLKNVYIRAKIAQFNQSPFHANNFAASGPWAFPRNLHTFA